MRLLDFERPDSQMASWTLPEDGISQLCGLGNRNWRSEATSVEFSPIRQVWQTSTSYLIFTRDNVYKVWRHEHPLIDNLGNSETRRTYLQGEQNKGNGIGSEEAYLGVLPVALLACDQGEYSLAELHGLDRLPSQVNCDWALKMKRFPDEDRWDKMLAVGRLTDEMVANVAEKIITYHRQLPESSIADTLAAAGTFDQRVRKPDFAAMRSTGIIAATAINELDAHSANFLKTQTKLFDQAIQTGRIKNGHGDCKITNFYTAKGLILDAIAFKDDWSCNDLLAEVAYLLLIFDYIDRENFDHWFELVNQVYYRITNNELTNDPLFWFYMNYRAWVEAKVAGFEARDAYVAADNTEGLRKTAKAQKYLELAGKYLRTAYQVAGMS